MRPEAASDLFSSLSDELVCCILSKLHVREAVRSSVLSQRWRFLYTKIPQLTITPHLLLLDDDDDDKFDSLTADPLVTSKVENIISNILLMHSSDLEVFDLDFGELGNGIPWRFTHQNLWKWMRIVAQKNVQHLNLRPDRDSGGQNPPPAIFSCTCLRTLHLSNYTLPLPPTHFNGFNHLVTCSFDMIDLTDESLAAFTSHCPLLQKLILRHCFGLLNPIISAPNIAHLDLSGCFDQSVDGLTVSCPKLQTYTVNANAICDLSANGLLFHALSRGIVRLQLERGSKLIGLTFRWYSRRHEFPAERFVEIIGNFKSLKNLVVLIPQPLLLLNLLDRLPNLESLHIDGMCGWGMAGDAIPPFLASPLANLRMIKVDIKKNDGSEIFIVLVGCLLQSTPALEIMEIKIRLYVTEERRTEVLVKLLEMRRASSRAKIMVHIIE